jgi:SAM-dependent methyltransferase
MRAAIRIDGWTCTTLLPHENPSTLDHKLDCAPRGGRSRRQSFALGRVGSDGHGCVRQLIDMPDSDRLRPVAVQDGRQFSPSAARNCVPIRELLTRVLPKKGIVLEIGSGTGEHVVCFAKALPGLVWLPSDPEGASRTSIEAWATSEGLTNVRAPVFVDVREEVWGVEDDAPFDAILSLNMVHIAPWQAALGLLAGVQRLLRPDGILFLYGPFMIGGRHTATTMSPSTQTSNGVTHVGVCAT